jgi:hypothetical protein
MNRPHEHDPTPLGQFPAEIWEACCRFSSPKDFSSLAEVSTFVQAATRRIRFQSLTFSCPSPSEIGRRNVASWTNRMLRGRSRVTSLSADDAASDIRTFVREWKIDGDRLLQKNVPQYPAGILLAQEARLAISACVESLPVYTNLVTLTLVLVDIDQRARSSLSLLPSLQFLSLNECNTCHTTGLRLRLKQFSWEDSAISIESGPIELLDPEELCELRLIGFIGMKNVLTPLMTNVALADSQTLRCRSLYAPMRRISFRVSFNYALRYCPSTSYRSQKSFPRSRLPLLRTCEHTEDRASSPRL